MRRYALCDDQWGRIEQLLPGKAVSAADNRLFVEAVLSRSRAGIAWRDLPERFGDFRVIQTGHMRWSRKGVGQCIFNALAKDADSEYVMIDSTIVRVHQPAAGAKGASRKAKALGDPAAGRAPKSTRPATLWGARPAFI